MWSSSDVAPCGRGRRSGTGSRRRVTSPRHPDWVTTTLQAGVPVGRADRGAVLEHDRRAAGEHPGRADDPLRGHARAVAGGRDERAAGDRVRRRACVDDRLAADHDARARHGRHAPGRRACRSRWRRRGGRSRASDHVQRAVVDGHLRALQLDRRRPSRCRSRSRSRSRTSFCPLGGLERDPADAGRVVERDLWPPSVTHHAPSCTAARAAPSASRRAEPHQQPRPDRVVGIAVLELDPDARPDRRQREEADAAAAERRAGHRPAALVLAEARPTPWPGPGRSSAGRGCRDHAAVLAEERCRSHGTPPGGCEPVPSRLRRKLWRVLARS